MDNKRRVISTSFVLHALARSLVARILVVTVLGERIVLEIQCISLSTSQFKKRSMSRYDEGYSNIKMSGPEQAQFQ